MHRVLSNCPQRGIGVRRPAFALPGSTALAVCVCLASTALLYGCGQKAAPPQAPMVRSLKTMTVHKQGAAEPKEYPGKVLAGERVQLAFDVSGTLVELNAQEGQKVEAGQVIARLDPRDFDNAIDSARAELDRAKAQFGRVEVAAKSNAVSQQELSDARATVDKAQAEFEIKAKAREDSVMTARFDGVIATRHVDNYSSVQAKQPIVSLQRITDVEIEIFIPESQVLSSRRESVENRELRGHVVAVFDARPDVEYPLELKEFSTEADPATQTFRVVLTMPAPQDSLVLPGMTVRVRVTPTVDLAAEGAGFRLPLTAVPVDGSTGKYSVWLVKDAGNGNATVHRQFVDVGETLGDSIAVTGGLNEGDRIATVGVHVLQEGQTVRPIEEPAQ